MYFYLISISYKRPFDKGNLYIKFEIKFPPARWIDDSKLTQLASLFPSREKPSYKAEEVEEVVLSNVDPMQQGRASSQMDMDEDEDHHGHQGPGVQCAQQ